jgi:hypothetical protein
MYVGRHEVDFEAAKVVLKHFVSKGYRESSALALCLCLQLLNFSVGKRFVAILADGKSMYSRMTVNAGVRYEGRSRKLYRIPTTMTACYGRWCVQT